jgi:zinc transporter ZupT
VTVIIWTDPADSLRDNSHPLVEELRFNAVRLQPGVINLTVLNDGPDQVSIAQVQIDDAFWAFESDRGTVLQHLDRTTLTIPYPWVSGDTHVVRLVTSNGVTFDYEIAVAVETPMPEWRFFAAFTIIGLYVGVIPVMLGLLWFPLVSRLGKTGLAFLLSLTIGLLLFLFVDTGREGLEIAAVMPESYHGVALLLFSAATAYLGLEALRSWLSARKARANPGMESGKWVVALLVAIGIGLHNFGEGLAIGAAFAQGAAGLGTLLIVGFTLHNTTEGLAIVAPLANERTRIVDLLKLGLIGGIPTILGTWLGGFVYSPVWSVLFLGVGAGAIAQVVVQITRQMAADAPAAQFLAKAPVLGGLCAGFGIMYVTGMLVG